MNDETLVDDLGFRTRTRNCLKRVNVYTVGGIKEAIKSKRIEHIRDLGISGIMEVVNFIEGISCSDDSDLVNALEYFQNKYGSFCKILRKDCPVNKKRCEECSLHIVYNDFLNK